ncbi:MAG: GntR family transcriptional regulator [Bryobacterales bacterium]|nr:GntR family transcriptional regulator [Bryobacterales bacterium]MBV9400574.1 GntR family transcriptional regulator [Bryobacterales bacterium]
MNPQPKTRSIAPSEDSQTARTLLNLRGMILRGDFRAGDRISELPLVARLGVSRTPIRLALDRLCHEGLLEVAPAGGFVVRGFTVDDIWDAIELRGILEGSAARLACERLIAISDLNRLRHFRDAMEAHTFAGSPPPIEAFAHYMDMNEAFHAEIVALAKSPLLRESLERVTALPFAAPSSVVFANVRVPNAVRNFAIGQEHHSAIVEAIELRQAARAEGLAREHSRLARRNLEAILGDKSMLSQVPGGSLIKLPAAV